jgi:hypothetical protein
MFGQDEAKAVTALTDIDSKPFLKAKEDFKVTGMPKEDYEFWLKNLVRSIAKDEAEKAKSDYENYLVASQTRTIATIATAAVAKPVASGRRGRSKTTSTIVAPRRSARTDTALKLVEEKARLKFGFKDNEHLTAAKWLTKNGGKLSAAVKGVLDNEQNHFGVALADYNKLTAGDDAASNTISNMISY